MAPRTSLTAVPDMAESTESEHGKQLQEILDSWARWQRALSEKDRIGKQCKEAETAAYARFQDTIEAGIDATADKAEIVTAHYETVAEWQSYQECLAGCKEARKAAREVVADAAALMNEKIQESRQMVLPFGEPDENED